MQTFANIITISALAASVAAFPAIQVRDTCGSTPSASASQTPIAQPTGITTAEACQQQCDANGQCQSFVFGMVNNVIECSLYSVAASSVPTQSSTGLVVYDKGCSSVPTTAPTSSTGQTGSNGNGGNSNSNPRLAIRDTCGTAPTSTSGSASPLSTPAGITTAAGCQAQCEANSQCQSFVFGMVSNADQCILYNGAASAIPTQTSTNLVAYDKACASVPSQTPTASNPTGSDTGSSTSSSGSTTGSGSGSTGSGSTGSGSSTAGNTGTGSTPGQ